MHGSGLAVAGVIPSPTIRKPDAFAAEGIAAYVVQPVRLAVSTGQIKQNVRRP
jgi:hypothetical protein